jgi:hypothetical protein
VVDRAGLPDYKPPLPSAFSKVQGNAQVAQLVEHATENRSVGGSIPPLGTMNSFTPAIVPVYLLVMSSIAAVEQP